MLFCYLYCKDKLKFSVLQVLFEIISPSFPNVPHVFGFVPLVAQQLEKIS